MPTFIPKGPFVPDRLVQQLEEDKVVIFCGAGISMGAGLPSYAGLVKYCYQELGERLPPEKSSEWLWPDRMLGTLENHFTPADMRGKVAERLDQLPTDVSLHKAILQLAKIRRGDGLRLVTTNFDKFFEHAQAGLTLGNGFHSGPVLPIPRNDRSMSWKSIVYLHGRLAPTGESNDHLILTSADFGRAYLTEAWAARFVSRLFADFTVLFIGYSLNDPVLRYMTDAFAAEDLSTRGRAPRGPAYIFLPYKGRTQPDPQPWIERRIIPIFYHDMRHHARLKRTLIAWAEARQDYLSNTEVLIRRIAPKIPAALNPSDVDNLIWAIVGRQDDEGHGARVFANLPNAPPVQWLTVLARFEMRLAEEHQKNLQAAIQNGADAPSPPILHLDSLFLSGSNENSNISKTSLALIFWFGRHLSSTELVDWLLENLRANRRLHPSLRYTIREKLAENNLKLGDGFIRFWRIVSSEGQWALRRSRTNVPWNLRKLLKHEPEAPWSNRELAEAFRPVLTLRPSFLGRSPAENIDEDTQNSYRLSQIADAEVELLDDAQVPVLISALDTLPNPDAYWGSRLDLLTNLLKDVFDLYAVAGSAYPDYDPTAAQRPSIAPHPQNHNFKHWTIFFDLIWRGWKNVDSSDPALSREYITRWRRIPYLGFRRLALAAIGSSSNFSSIEKLEALLNG
jgi:hypothetical protein